MDKEEYYALIEKKIDGTLTSEEQIIFEHQLQNNPEFAKAYRLQSLTVHHFRRSRRRQLQQTLEADYQAHTVKQTKQRIFYHYTAVAATITLLLAGIATFFYFRTSSPETLFIDYYHPYRAKTVSRGVEQANRADNLYNTGQFAAAIPLLERLSEDNEDSSRNRDRWLLLLGNAYLQNDSISQAIEQFKEVTFSQDIIYQQYGSWYLALSYLRQGDIATAEDLLQPIAQQPGLFQRDAQQLLEEIC